MAIPIKRTAALAKAQQGVAGHGTEPMAHATGAIVGGKHCRGKRLQHLGHQGKEGMKGRLVFGLEQVPGSMAVCQNQEDRWPEEDSRRQSKEGGRQSINV